MPKDHTDYKDPVEAGINAARLLHDLPLAVFCTDDEGTILYSNKAFNRLCGLEAEQISGMRPPYSFWPAPHPDPATLAREKEKPVEASFRRPDGNETRCRVQISPLPPDDQPAGYTLSCTEITDKNPPEAGLNPYETSFSAIFDALPIPLSISSLPDLRFLRVNQCFLDKAGFKSPREVLGLSSHNLQWISQEEKEKHIQRVTENPQLTESEMRIQGLKGDVYTALLMTRHLKLDGADYLLSASVDISDRQAIEKALRDSESFSSSLLKYSANPVLVSNRKGRIKFVNPALEKLTGYRAEEIIGDVPPYRWWPPEEAERYRQESWESSQNQDEHIERRFVNKDGEDFWVSISHRRVSEDGKLKFYLNNWVDITASKKAQAALQLSEQNFHESIMNSPLGIRIVNRQGETLFANKAFLKIFGYQTPEEYDAVPSRQRFTRTSYLAHMDRRKRRKAGLPVNDKYEVDIIRKDRSVRHLMITRGEVIWNNCKQFQVIYQDITEKTLAEKGLQENELKYRTLYEQMAQGAITYDARGRVLTANPAAEKIFGFKTEAIRKNPLKNLKKAFIREDGTEIAPGDLPVPIVRRTRQSVRDMVVGVFNPVDKKYHWINCNAIPKYRNGYKTLQGVDMTFSDITAAKEGQALAFETEALKRVNRTKTDLLANVSHELRTPLASIKGFIETLLEPDVEWTPEQQKDFLMSANQEADRLTFLIRDLLDMSRLEAGRMRLDKQKVTVEDILEAASRVLSILGQNHKLKITAAPDLPAIMADKMRLAQVITNLVENACKFSPTGSRVEITITRDGGHVVFSVSDQGIGMDEETIAHLFDRFYQARMVVVGKTRGTGLGLSIARGIVESHDGHISVSSQISRGSVFSFYIPIE